MEKYRRTVIIRCWLMGMLVVVGVGIIIFDHFFAEAVTPLNSAGEEYRGGFCAGLIVSALCSLWTYTRALRDPARMEQLYVDDRDERKIAIRAKAGVPVILYTSCALVLAALVASYINQTVFYTLGIAGVAQMVLGCILKFYYSKTM